MIISQRELLFSFDDEPQMNPIDFMNRLGLTTEETAIALRCSVDAIKSWRSGRRKPSEIFCQRAYKKFVKLTK